MVCGRFKLLSPCGTLPPYQHPPLPSNILTPHPASGFSPQVLSARPSGRVALTLRISAVSPASSKSPPSSSGRGSWAEGRSLFLPLGQLSSSCLPPCAPQPLSSWQSLQSSSQSSKGKVSSRHSPFLARSTLEQRPVTGVPGSQPTERESR